jgi:FixJ family two-component response regulator
VVHLLTDAGPEQAALDSTLSGGGFLVQPVAPATPSFTLQGGLEPTCLVVDGRMLPLVPPEQRAMPMICLVAEGDVATTVQAMRAGAVDVLARPAAVRLLVEAVRNALEVSAGSLRQAAERRQIAERHADLSQREREVMGLVVTGLMNKQVAYELQISEITVKAHRGRMMRKMKARSLASLVQMANALGLAAPIRHS